MRALVAIAGLTAALACGERDRPVAPPRAIATSSASGVAREYDPYVALLLEAIRASRAGKIDDALDALVRLEGTSFDFPPDDLELGPLRDDPRYRALVVRMMAREPKTPRSATAFTAGGGLLAEGIAFDPRSGAFFLGSIARRKIVRIDSVANGTVAVRDLVREGQDDLTSVLGMKFDARRNVLWAATNDEKSKPRAASVFAFDPETGALRRRVTTSGAHLFNDVAFDERGNLFVTDSEGGGVYLVPAHVDVLVPFLEPRSFVYPNGIALSDDPPRIFVAHQDGIAVIDRSTKSVRPLAHDARVTLAGIDGLALHGRALLAVQNGLGRPRVVRVELDVAMTRAERVVVLETENPAFHVPTTGVVARGSFFYIANSQIDREESPRDALDDVVILELRL